MWCSEVRERLVAWRDDELGASEGAQVAEHVGGCASCREHDRKLAASRPHPPRARVPADLEARLARALDPDLLLARAATRPPPPAST
ncbi:MAG: zf-HC2 domain-containing protein, partial [Myxococcota bacterium]